MWTATWTLREYAVSGGRTLTDEHKAKISAALRGRPLTAANRAGISRAMRGEVPPHGNRNRYKRLGCRCESCRTAQADYARAHRQSRARSTTLHARHSLLASR